MAPSCPIIKLEKLLLSTDGSEFSEGAVREAINIAKICSSKLFVVSVVETNPEFEALAPQVVEKSENETRQHLESVKSRASKEGVDCEINTYHNDQPFQSIVDDAAKKQVDMVIMGRRGRTGLKRLLMGSVTAKVIGHAPCKVLVVPRAARIEFKNILVATDGSRYSEAAINEAIGIAKLGRANLTAVSVVPSETKMRYEHGFIDSKIRADLEKLAAKESPQAAENNVKIVKEKAEKEGVSSKGFIVTGVPHEAIVDIAKETNADLILVGSHGRTGLSRLMMGSVTERVIGHADCAVLVVKC